ncbi:putative uncharacterized protein DDB_G0291608 [Anastrepha obliqua]|uniref:putative uncharacterized protein DDB_G0291608 n=1 Tax=Anastrepha obliqua TaxID=95512 RepID=UPI002409C8C3|nr:putative uncharacterized protein DDB_G0291608 [Anastrepha obliqua]
MATFIAHLSVLLAATVLLCGFVQCANEAEHTKNPTTTTTTSPTNPPTITETNAVQLMANSTRLARLLKVLQDPKMLAGKRYQAAAPRLIARGDHLQPAGMPYRRLPAHAAAPSSPAPYHKVRPPIMRRVQNGLPINAGPPRFTFETSAGGLSHLPSKGPVPFNAGKVTVYRPPFGYTQLHHQPNPNALVPQSATAFQATKHQQQQLQQQQHHEEYNFKASPPFSGKAIVRPLLQPHDPNYRQHVQQLQQYAGKPQQVVQQYPIPQQEQQQQKQQKTSQFPTLFQSQKQYPNRPPTFHYETMRAHEEPVLHPHVKHEQPPPGGAGYAVYEHNELAEEEPPYAHPNAYYPPTPMAEQPAQQHQSLRLQAQQTHPETAAAQEAEEYIKFMNSNDYFLPKHEPNYKRLDAQQDSHQLEPKEQREQQQQPTHSHYAYKQQPLEHLQYSKSAVSDSTSSGSATSAATNYLNQPIQVSQLFYQEDPVPAIVRGSYQAGNNLFVVNSEGNKAVKHIVPPPSTRAPTTLAPVYPNVRYNTLHSHTPEPLRFEFTERDAVHSTYTNSPPSLGNERQHLWYRTANGGSSSTTPDLPTSSTGNFATATTATADDPEDEEDVHSASSDFYGRIPMRKSTLGDVPSESTSPAPVEQKDTEDYCERICANIQDDDEEIVCGSDGYMYTSEAQMECYATCLHIDVTVQSKGSCNTR